MTLTEIVDERDGKIFALKSRDNAEDSPDYVQVALLYDLHKNPPTKW